MAKISAYPNGGTLQTTDELVVRRGGVNKSILGSDITYPAGYLFGCRLSNNVADAANDIDIAAGKCRDSSDADNIVLASALTKRLDAAWSVGTNQGGLDTGAIANTTYHVWLIKRPDTGVVDALFSASATAPTMPANYTYKRRIGSIIRSGGAIVGFLQDGDIFTLNVPVSNTTLTNPGTAAVTVTTTVPMGIRVQAMLSVLAYSNGLSPAAVFVSDLSITDSTPSLSAFSISLYSAGQASQGGMVYVFTNTSGQVRYRIQISNADTVIYSATNGWIDTRGRLA